MESENNKKIYFDEEGNLAAYRRRYSKLILLFKLFFTSLALIMGALIIYLVQSESSDHSIHQNPSVQISSDPKIITTEPEIFKLSLQRAAQELENATALILSNYSAASDVDAKSELALSNCRILLQNGSGQLREAIGVNPIPRRRPSNEQRVEMANRIVVAEKSMNSCLDELETVESTAAANEVRERVFGAAAFLSERGYFLMSRRDEIWKTVDAVWAVILEYVVVICLYGLQMSFIFFLFWTIIKSR